MEIIDKCFPYRVIKENNTFYIEKFIPGFNYWYRYIGSFEHIRDLLPYYNFYIFR